MVKKTLKGRKSSGAKRPSAKRPAQAPLSEEILVGVVTKRMRSFYYVTTDEGESYECKIKGSLFRTSRYDNQVAVGDRVRFRHIEGQDKGLIEAIEERKSFLSRQRVGKDAEQVIAANLDYLFLVQSAKDPGPRRNLVFRMMTAAILGKVKPVLVITKADLANPLEIEAFCSPFKTLGLEIFVTGQDGGGRDQELLEMLRGHVSVLSGPSGVGKSSLINRLIPGLNLRVGEISETTGKGAHTTTYALMLKIAEDSYVIDTPGIREFGLWGVNEENLHEHFPGLHQYEGKCFFKNCRHLTEPKCEVKRALAQGELDERIYQGYQDLIEDILHPAPRGD